MYSKNHTRRLASKARKADRGKQRATTVLDLEYAVSTLLGDRPIKPAKLAGRAV